MKVSLSILPKSVLVTILTDDASEAVGPDATLILEPDTQLSSIPYERLRSLGEGVHELFDQPHFRIRKQVHHGPFTWGNWLGLAGLALLGAAVSYWGFDHWEQNGGRVRIHWVVALLYALGGKQAVAGVFGIAAFGCLGSAFRTILAGREKTRKKHHQIREALEEMAEEQSQITFVARHYERRLFVGHQAGQYTLYLPEQFLTNAEIKRAVNQFGPAHPGEPDPHAETVPPGFVEPLRHDLDCAADRILDVFSRVYQLHPCTDISAECLTCYVDDEAAYGNESPPGPQPELVPMSS